MTDPLKPIRRVVAGHDERGRSVVAMDGPAPNTSAPSMGSGRRYTDLWVWEQAPLSLSDPSDGGNIPYDFPGPADGGHLRVVQAHTVSPDFNNAEDSESVALHEPRLRPPGRMWDRGGNNAYTSAMHKTETVDYGICLEGERILVLDDGELAMAPGDVVIQVGAFHAWTNPRKAGLMAFDMIGARFVDGAAGLGQGNDPPMMPPPGWRPPDGVAPVRRIVTIDREPGVSSLVSDGPAPDVKTDPARPGFAATRLWVTDSTPARIVFETLHLHDRLEPPPNGSVMRIMTFPPDATWQGKVGEPEVRAWFAAMGAPDASTYAPDAPHPYMQRTGTFDFCFVLKGEIVLVLDGGEATLMPGECAILRGANHAWSNRSDSPAVVAVASHDAV
jgi:quercetin dioxygenase-like cupin family protein